MLHVVGVRHHSPACSRLVRHVLQTVRPKHVLIEGPADMNDRIDELRLGHSLPVALFSYYTSASRHHASWSPFCSYSPEWVAIEESPSVGAVARFMDLPAWAAGFQQRNLQNRYADAYQDSAQRAVKALCERIGVDGMDALWDHLFEQPIPPEELQGRLEVYFAEMRGQAPGGVDAAREDHMAQCIAWAMDDCGPDEHVVVVCGGWHKPALERMWTDFPAEWPTEAEVEEGSRIGSYLVPYSFPRLDSFTGYESGMPSPAFYQAVWDLGVQEASDALLQRAVQGLRARKLVVSPADVIAANTLTQGLQKLRGHAAPLRVDLLDGLAGALVKDALDQPLPWSGRGTLKRGTDPMLVEMVRAFSGDKRGRLHPDTPRPPLLADVDALLEHYELVPDKRARLVDIRLDNDVDRDRSRVLHQLRVLGIPGFERQGGPSWATDSEIAEKWKLRDTFERESMLIEAAAYGATLATAAAAKLEENLVAAGSDLGKLADILGDATFIGIDLLADRVLGLVNAAIGQASQLEPVGTALTRLLALWRHDALLGAKHSAAIGAVIEAAFERGLWLFEEVQGPTLSADPGRIRAAVALRDTLRHAGGKLQVDAAACWSVMGRRSFDVDAPPDIRGAALGLLWSTSAPGATEDDAHRAVKGSALPESLGDFLAGLFALAREEVIGAPDLVGAVDTILGDFEDRDFVVALPSLRLAFEYFPPREKETLAELLLTRHGGNPIAARDMLRLEADAGLVLAAVELERQVHAWKKRYGLLEPTEEAS